MTEANPYLIDRLLSVQDQVLKAYAELEPTSPGHLADLRQVLIEHFLRPLFSAHRRFTSGRITDATGVLTEQLDLILEHGFMPSFPLHDGTSRLVLAEAVALVIEVADQPGKDDAYLREVFSHIHQLSRQIKPTIKFQGAPSEREPVSLRQVFRSWLSADFVALGRSRGRGPARGSSARARARSPPRAGTCGR